MRPCVTVLDILLLMYVRVTRGEYPSMPATHEAAVYYLLFVNVLFLLL